MNINLTLHYRLLTYINVLSDSNPIPLTNVRQRIYDHPKTRMPISKQALFKASTGERV